MDLDSLQLQWYAYHCSLQTTCNPLDTCCCHNAYVIQTKPGVRAQRSPLHQLGLQGGDQAGVDSRSCCSGRGLQAA